MTIYRPNKHTMKTKIFRILVDAYPRDYKTAIMMLKKKKEIEAYHDKITKSNGAIIEVISIDGFFASHLPSESYMESEFKAPDFVAVTRIEVRDRSLFFGVNREQIEPIVKKELTKILRGVGISTSNVKISSLTYIDTPPD